MPPQIQRFFFGTNEGAFHAIDTSTSKKFAFVTRSGRNYYALDATNRDNPKVLREIQGGTGDYALLGQTWSKPVKTKIHIGGHVKDVLIVGGGFDPIQDGSPNARLEHGFGNAIYFIDAVTGERLWWASSGASTGEKALSTPLIINGLVIFTTYSPEAGACAACSAVSGQGRVYLLNLFIANSIPGEDGVVKKDDRTRDLKAKSITPSPKVLFPEGASKPLILIGPESLSDIGLILNANWERSYLV